GPTIGAQRPLIRQREEAARPVIALGRQSPGHPFRPHMLEHLRESFLVLREPHRHKASWTVGDNRGRVITISKARWRSPGCYDETCAGRGQHKWISGLEMEPHRWVGRCQQTDLWMGTVERHDSMARGQEAGEQRPVKWGGRKPAAGPVM